MANTTMVPSDTQPHQRETNNFSFKSPDSTSSTKPKTSPGFQSVGLQAINDNYKLKGFNDSVINTMFNAKSVKTYQQYHTYLGCWEKFCADHQINVFRPPIGPVLNFLQQCREDFNLGYSAVNTARSALATIVSCEGAPLADNSDLSTYMKGVKNESPHLPKYSAIWDADLLLDYLNAQGLPSSLDLKQLTLKLAALLLVSSGQRVQSLERLSLDNLLFGPDLAQFTILSKLKQTMDKATEICFKSFPENQNLCPVAHLSHYIEITQPLCSSPNLFISFQKPRKAVGSQTISRWVRNVLASAGIDLTRFGAHSVRASSSAAAKRGGVTLDTILNAGSWSRAGTFQTWYDKPILQNTPSFQDALMSKHKDSA